MVEDTSLNFKFINFGSELEINIDDNNQAQCPKCQKRFKQLFQHLKKNKDCASNLDLETFKIEYQAFSHRRRQKIHRQKKLETNIEERNQAEAERKRKARAIQLNIDADKTHKNEAKKKKQVRERKLNIDADETHKKEAEKKRQDRERKLNIDADETHKKEAEKKRQERERKLNIDADETHKKEAEKKRQERERKLNIDAEETHKNEAKKQRKIRERKLNIDAAETHKNEAEKQKGQRKRKLIDNTDETHRAEAMKKKNERTNLQIGVTQTDRLRKFKRAVMFGPIFVCSCCHVKHFETNVTQLDDNLKIKLLEKYPECYAECIRNLEKVMINEDIKYYLCKTCLTYMKSSRVPPMSVCNSLDVVPIQDPELQLSELENNLIALRIMFQKIYYLPKSRWTAIKDRVINIPVEKENIINTIEKLPRLPIESGLVEVKLKRKLEYTNNHKREFVDPNKIFKALEYLKASGHPGYTDFDTMEEYINRCYETDKEGYNSLFGKEYQIDEVLETLEPLDIDLAVDHVIDQVNNTEEEELDEESYYKENDAVAKFQFDYDRSTCLTEKYPEVSVTDESSNQELCFAPGEGKYPKDILMDKSWDINAFPLLHPNGKFGLNEKRETTVRLTEQSYFKQRIRNKNSQFIDNKAYLYSAVAYVERKQLQSNINLSFTKGKKSTAADGSIQYELDDAFQVFENIKNTPRYWRKAKFEMLAKLDNLGPFQFFFTLSSADMRWEENFTSILRERGIKIQYDFETLESKIITKHPDMNKNITKPLADYLRDDVDETLHEIIRTNVLTAVLNFNQRFTAFKKEIMFGANNPMSIEYFSSKIEFQMRGAGHIHGTLWCDLDKLDNEDEQDTNRNIDYCFPGIKRIFGKIRRNEIVNENEEIVLARFVDAFTTCSLNADEVGANVVKIAAKVNCHHHTFTCKKFCNRCRFGYPKYPMWKTVIAMPRTEEKSKVEKYTETLNRVKILLETPEVLDGIMSKYQKNKENQQEYEMNRKKRILELLDIANVTELEYLEALKYSKAGYSVILKRDLDEIYINSYNPEWLEAWDGNIDIQPTFDYYAVLTYITEYFCKTDSTMQELLKEAAKNIDSQKTQREKKILLSNTFLTHRQMGEAEAIYKLMPNLKMKDSNVGCVFLQTGTKNERSKFLMSIDNDRNWHDKVGMQVKGKEGLVIEKPDIVDKYCRKHKSLGMICPSHFAKIYESASTIPKKYCKEESDNEDELDTDDEDCVVGDDIDANAPKNKWHFVMSYRNEHSIPLPKYFKLDPVYPGEPAYMRRRDYPACLRFHKVKEHTDPQKYFKSQIMLYTHFKSEDELHFDDPQWVENKFKESHDGMKRNIQIVKDKVMEHLESVEEARYFVDELHKNQIQELGDALDAQNVQDELECQEEDIIEHPDFAHLNPDELEIVEDNGSKPQSMRTIETGSLDELITKSRGYDKYQRIVVEMGIRYARDIVKSRNGKNRFPDPVHVMVHGGAGSGKSTVIDGVAKWIQHVIVKSGDNPMLPYTVKAGPTGAAASIIDGQTMHSLFNFSFGNEFFSLSDKVRDEKRLMYQNLNIIIIDEISLVKSDMQFQLDLRLREVKMDDRLFGGVSVFVFGDIMQMRPVMGNYIFQKPISKEYELAYLQGNHWQSFKVINLEENHRQGDDKEYANILNRIRIGEQTEADIEVLKTRVRQPLDPDILQAKDALYISAKNKEVKKINDERMEKLSGEEFISEAIHIHQTMKNYKPKIDKDTGRIAKTSFVDKLKLKIGAKVMLIHNIDTVDGLTNGCIGILVDVLKTKGNKPDKLIIEFTNPKHGELKRHSNQALNRRYPNGTPIEPIMFAYTLSKRASGVANSAKLVQFPICVAFATTCHKFQGQTVPRHLKLIIDLRHIWGAAMAYVMLSRVMQLSQLFIIGEVNEKKIYPDSAALEELKRMNDVSINKNPSNWNREAIKGWKISSLNCRSLRSKLEDIRKDFELCQSDIICLSETWLKQGEQLEDLQVEGYSLHVNSVGFGKGLATYFKRGKFKPGIDVKEDDLQISKFTSELFDVVSVYRSKDCKLKFEDVFKNMLSEKKPSLIIGDMNICYQQHGGDKNIQYLEEKKYKQLVNGATHIMGGHIDHAYLKDHEQTFRSVDVVQYSPYYTSRDHDGLLVTLMYE